MYEALSYYICVSTVATGRTAPSVLKPYCGREAGGTLLRQVEAGTLLRQEEGGMLLRQEEGGTLLRPEEGGMLLRPRHSSNRRFAHVC